MSKMETALTLFQKIAQELGTPGQLLDTQRRQQLLSHALVYINAILATSDSLATDTQELLYNLESSKIPDKNIEIVHSPTFPMVAAIFSQQSQFKFYRDAQQLPKHSNLTSSPFITIAGPSVQYLGTPAHRQTAPAFGYRFGDQVSSPFRVRDEDSQVQHGGISISPLGQLEIHDYTSLTSRWYKAPENTVVIQTDWYMSSANQHSVTKRPNMQTLRTYNTLGAIKRPPQPPLLFTTNSDPNSISELLPQANLTQNTRSRVVSVEEVATLANALTAAVEGQSWQLVGLEFMRGGTYTHIPDSFGNPTSYFLVKTN